MSDPSRPSFTQCPSVYPPSATGPYSDETGVGWSGPLRCVMSEAHEGDKHWNSGIRWFDADRQEECHIAGHPDWCKCPVVKRDQCRGSDLCCVNCGNPWGSKHDLLCHAYGKARRTAEKGSQT